MDPESNGETGREDPEAPEETPSSPAAPRAEPGDGITRETLGFLLRFAIVVGSVSTLLYVDENFNDAAILGAISRVYYLATLASLKLAALDVSFDRGYLVYKTRPFLVIRECLGLEVLGIYAGAVIGFPVGWAERWRGLRLGIPVLMFANYLRIMTLVIFGHASRTVLDLGHLYIWPTLLIAIAAGIWLLWARGLPDELDPPA